MDTTFKFVCFLVGPMHCSRTRKYFFSKSTLKLGPTVLVTHLKIILLQYFQFSTISDIQIDPYFLEKMNYFDIR